MAGIDTALKGVGANGKRHALDFYPTPPEVTKALLYFLVGRQMLLRGDVIWEPACGDMAMVDVMEDCGFRTIATDVAMGNNFLTTSPNHGFRWIITNPPFSQAEKFIRRAALFDVPFAFLLKSQYWHSAKRLSLFEEIKPAYVLPLTWRPDFTGHGASLMDMCWVIWHGMTAQTLYIPMRKPKGEV